MNCPECGNTFWIAFMDWNKVKTNNDRVRQEIRLCYNCRQRLKREGKIE